MKNNSKNQIIVIRSDSLRRPISRFEVREIAYQLLEDFSLLKFSLEIKLTHDQEIALLNHSFLEVLAPTNILSFPETDPGKDLLGLLIISVEALWRETFLYGQSMSIYLVRLLAHGILHLAGYEHGETMDRLTEQAVFRVTT